MIGRWYRGNPALPYLWIGKITSSTGDWLYNVASLFLILYLTNSALLVSLYMLAKMIPGLVFSPYGGVFSDRFNRRTVMILTDLVRIGAALLPLFVVSEEQVWLIILSAALLTSASSVFFPAEKGLVTEVAAGDLAKTNSVMASGEAISMIVGSALGGIVASENVKLAFIINAATFAVSLITTIAINLASPAQKKGKTEGRSPLFESPNSPSADFKGYG